jgi:hypothetical protein
MRPESKPLEVIIYRPAARPIETDLPPLLPEDQARAEGIKGTFALMVENRVLRKWLATFPKGIELAEALMKKPNEHTT